MLNVAARCDLSPVWRWFGRHSWLLHPVLAAATMGRSLPAWYSCVADCRTAVCIVLLLLIVAARCHLSPVWRWFGRHCWLQHPILAAATMGRSLPAWYSCVADCRTAACIVLPVVDRCCPLPSITRLAMVWAALLAAAPHSSRRVRWGARCQLGTLVVQTVAQLCAQLCLLSLPVAIYHQFGDGLSGPAGCCTPF